MNDFNMAAYKNKIVWITGASSGIGEALVYQFAKQGATVLLSARRKAELERVKKNCGDNSTNCFIYPFDLTDYVAMEAVVKQVMKDHAKVDVLVNNGGISQRSLIEETPLEIDRKVFELDYFSQIALTKAVLPSMLHQHSGQIVVISSIVGKFGFPLRSAYSAAKHALHGFFETLLAECGGRGIKVNMVLPGRIRTNVSYHAITQDGSENGVMDHALDTGYTPERCAYLIMKGISRNKKEIYIAGKEMIMINFRRFVPFLYYKLVSKVKPT